MARKKKIVEKAKVTKPDIPKNSNDINYKFGDTSAAPKFGDKANKPTFGL